LWLSRSSGYDLIVASSGNIGIGTTTPSSLLHVYGTTPTIKVQGSSTNSAKVDLIGTYTTWSLENQYVNGATNDMFRIYNSSLSADAITINRSTNNVGIGTSSPAYKLDVAGSVYSSNYFSVLTAATYGPSDNSAVMQVFGSTGSGGLTNTIKFVTGGSERVRIDSGGNVGIGTSSPTSKLHVIETTDTGSRIQLGTNSANSLMSSTGVNDFIILTAPFGPTPASTNNNGAKWGIKLNGSIDSPNTKGKAACIYAVSEEPGAGYNRRVGLALHTSPFDLDSVERLRISNDGNVGIGTTSPDTLLHVHGSSPFVRISNSSAANHGIKITYGSSETHGLHLLYQPGSALSFIDNTYPVSAGYVFGDIYFRQNVAGTMTTRMTIKADGGGNVGIGTTSPVAKLDVAGDSKLGSSISNVHQITGSLSITGSVTGISTESFHPFLLG
jgi:hypothetical protein